VATHYVRDDPTSQTPGSGVWFAATQFSSKRDRLIEVGMDSDVPLKRPRARSVRSREGQDP